MIPVIATGAVYIAVALNIPSAITNPPASVPPPESNDPNSERMKAAAPVLMQAEDSESAAARDCDELANDMVGSLEPEPAYDHARLDRVEWIPGRGLVRK